MIRIVLVVTVAIAAAWLQAEGQYSSQSGSTQAGTTASGQTTVQGCLQRLKGNYTLTDKSGTTYKLHGSSSNLDAHVGHEVQITGETSTPSATAPAMGRQAGEAQQPTLSVVTVKHVSEKCQSPTVKEE